MKKSILTFTVAFLFTCIIVSCNSSAKKVDNANESVAKAENNLDKANQELDIANKQYAADVESFKTTTAEKINANNESILEFKLRIANDKKEAKANYDKQIAELEQKNTDAKLKMDNYKTDTKDNWESFKTEFNHDMDELGQALNDLTKKNTK